MLRLTLIIALLTQLLVAPAAMAGIPCMHTSSEQAMETGADMNHMMTQHDQATTGGQQSQGGCCYGVTGHCAICVMAVLPKFASIDFVRGSSTPTNTAGVSVSGFPTHPYRPPVATA